MDEKTKKLPSTLLFGILTQSVKTTMNLLRNHLNDNIDLLSNSDKGNLLMAMTIIEDFDIEDLIKMDVENGIITPIHEDQIKEILKEKESKKSNKDILDDLLKDSGLSKN